MSSDEKPKKGRVTKVVLVDKDHKPVAASSFQVPDDPFAYGSNGLQEPPYNPERLLALSERHTTHQAALEQKTADVIGSGWHWKETATGADPGQRDRLDAWLRGLADPEKDETTLEVFQSAWDDLETLGYGAFEVARDSQNKVKRIYSANSHMVRFHKDGERLAQGVTGKRTWFRRWVPSSNRTYIHRKTGNILPAPEATISLERANELFVMRRRTKRSSHYGVPGYISAIGWISLSLAARDDNIMFFNNRREPRWAIILSNLEDDDGSLEDQLRQAFSVSLKDPHHNIFIPIEGNGKIDFKQLSQDTKDISFDRLQERATAEVLVAHKMPPDRLGAIRVGPLGGNTTVAASRVYKEAVVTPSQSFLAERINRFIAAESGEENIQWSWQPTELDLTEEAEDVTIVTNAWTASLMTWDEAREKLKLPRLEAGTGDDARDGGKFYHEIVTPEQAAAAGAGATAGARSGGTLAALGLGTFRGQQNAADKALDQASADLSQRIRDRLKPAPTE